MGQIENLEPKEVFFYFNEIAKIPHGSKNTKEISDYCVEFAKARNLKYYQDELNNVIIVKEATKGREGHKGVIIQGHLDMVTVQDEGVGHDFFKDPLNLLVDGDMLHAKGTSLGADNGIAVAYGLALLASETISHPHLEVILTVDEEIGLLGATAIDLSMIQGKYLINIDSDEEGMLLTSCAGGLRGTSRLPLKFVSGKGMGYIIGLKGLKGGHSGSEIDKERGNAIKLMGRLLLELNDSCDLLLYGLYGGEKDNAIPRDCTANIIVDEEDAKIFEETIIKMEKIYKEEYAVSDPDVFIQLEKLGEKEEFVINPIDFEKIIFLLTHTPDGIMHMSKNIEGLVETSLNNGMIHTSETELKLTASVRSSVRTRKEALSNQLQYLIEFLGGDYEVFGDYPEWAYKSDSELRTIMIDAYETLYGNKPDVQAIHAGLECGILLEKRPELDAVSIGPNMYDIHTPKERLSISSTKKVWDYLIEVLKRIA